MAATSKPPRVSRVIVALLSKTTIVLINCVTHGPLLAYNTQHAVSQSRTGRTTSHRRPPFSKCSVLKPSANVPRVKHVGIGVSLNSPGFPQRAITNGWALESEMDGGSFRDTRASNRVADFLVSRKIFW